MIIFISINNYCSVATAMGDMRGEAPHNLH
jgi:hypothetical protein